MNFIWQLHTTAKYKMVFTIKPLEKDKYRKFKAGVVEKGFRQHDIYLLLQQ